MFQNSEHRVSAITALTAFTYQNILKPILFLLDPETVHENMVNMSQTLGKYSFTRNIFSWLFTHQHPVLTQTIHKITFANPIGLAAGFDYQAKLPQILPTINFGFGTVGSITYKPYAGNQRPILGRLPKSKSLMVNKGFRNDGAKQTSQNMSAQEFKIPVGVSIGRTNTSDFKNISEAITDIINSFQIFENSQVQHAYYELNISCPNLHGDMDFYSSKNLNLLLDQIDNLNLKKPVFIKMPINFPDDQILEMLTVIADHSPAGVIFGNLQKDRTHKSLDQTEVAKFPVGNFSGKPTFDQSNHLITLAYKHFHPRLTIIGCGGVFSAQDAYLKIKLGASLVQLITGMIYQGPQLPSQICLQLPKLLKQDGFTHISQAIGNEVK